MENKELYYTIYGYHTEIVLLSNEKILEWKKTWNKDFEFVDYSKLLDIFKNNEIKNFYYSKNETEPVVLLWLVVGSNRCFFTSVFDFEKFKKTLTDIIDKNFWKEEGF
jgi:hypothetical protein